MAGLWPKMTSVSVLGVDTNVLVRFLANDDAKQSPLSVRLVSNSRNQPIYISLPVLVETYWVLSKVKRIPREPLSAAFSMLLSSPDFIVEKSGIAASALQAALDSRCDFTDALIAHLNAEAGCVATATFDRPARKLPGMISVEERL